MAILDTVFESKEYRLFVADHPCIVCLNSSNVDAHHWRTWASQRNDFFCVPLCREHHQSFHQVGKSKFLKMYRMEPQHPYDCMVKMFTAYWLINQK